MNWKPSLAVFLVGGCPRRRRDQMLGGIIREGKFRLRYYFVGHFPFENRHPIYHSQCSPDALFSLPEHSLPLLGNSPLFLFPLVPFPLQQRLYHSPLPLPPPPPPPNTLSPELPNPNSSLPVGEKNGTTLCELDKESCQYTQNTEMTAAARLLWEKLRWVACRNIADYCWMTL